MDNCLFTYEDHLQKFFDIKIIVIIQFKLMISVDNNLILEQVIYYMHTDTTSNFVRKDRIYMIYDFVICFIIIFLIFTNYF